MRAMEGGAGGEIIKGLHHVEAVGDQGRGAREGQGGQEDQ